MYHSCGNYNKKWPIGTSYISLRLLTWGVYNQNYQKLRHCVPSSRTPVIDLDDHVPSNCRATGSGYQLQRDLLQLFWTNIFTCSTTFLGAALIEHIISLHWFQKATSILLSKRVKDVRDGTDAADVTNLKLANSSNKLKLAGLVVGGGWG